MERKYADMYALFRHEHKAEAYFESLPDYVRDQISYRMKNVNTFDELRNCADHLLRGDG